MSRLMLMVMVAGLVAAVGCEPQEYDWSTNEWKPMNSEEASKEGPQTKAPTDAKTPVKTPASPHVCTILSVDKSAPVSIINGQEFSYTIRQLLLPFHDQVTVNSVLPG